MKVSKQLLRDFAYIANLYGWTTEDIEDAKAQTRANPDEMSLYWTRLASAHRAGYRQTPENNFIRLDQWIAINGDNRVTPVEVRDQFARTRVREGARCGHRPT
jgi:hypothetical protein